MSTPKVGPQVVNPAHRATVHEAPAKPAAPAAPALQGRTGTSEDAGRAQAFSDKFNVGGRKLGGVFAPRAKEVPSETHFSDDSFNALAGAMDLLKDAQAAGAVSNVGHDEIPADTMTQAGGFIDIFNAMLKNQGVA